jgi:hypothetical protein
MLQEVEVNCWIYAGIYYKSVVKRPKSFLKSSKVVDIGWITRSGPDHGHHEEARHHQGAGHQGPRAAPRSRRKS